MQQEQPPVCRRCGYENPGNYCSRCGVRQPRQPRRRSSPGSVPFQSKPKTAVVTAVFVLIITLALVSLLYANFGPDTDSPPGQADQTQEPDVLELASARHLNHRTAQAFVILGLKYEVDLEYDSLLAFFEEEAFLEEVSPIEVGLMELFHDEYDYANEIEEMLLKQGESPRRVLLRLSQSIASTKEKETTSPTTTSKTE